MSKSSCNKKYIYSPLPHTPPLPASTNSQQMTPEEKHQRNTTRPEYGRHLLHSSPHCRLVHLDRGRSLLRAPPCPRPFPVPIVPRRIRPGRASPPRTATSSRRGSASHRGRPSVARDVPAAAAPSGGRGDGGGGLSFEAHAHHFLLTGLPGELCLDVLHRAPEKRLEEASVRLHRIYSAQTKTARKRTTGGTRERGGNNCF